MQLRIAAFTYDEAKELYEMYLRHKAIPRWKNKLFALAIKWVLCHATATNHS